MQRPVLLLTALVLLVLPACRVDYRTLRRATLDLPDPDAAVAELPAEFRDGWIIVEASINGRGPYRLLLDTGAPFGHVSVAAATEIGLRPTNQSEVTDITDETRRMPVAYSRSVEIGPLRVTHLPFVISDSMPEGFLNELGVVGFLGYDAFELHTLDLDYPARALRVHTRRLDPDEPDAIPMRLEGHKPHVELRLGAPDAPARWFTIDSGGKLVLHLDAAADGWTRQDLATLIEPTAGLHGVNADLLTAPLVAPLRIGEHEVYHAVGEIKAPGCIIGHPLLSRFRVRLDARSGLASFTPVERDGPVLAPRPATVGIMRTVRLEDGVWILRVRANSPAARAGVRPGDQLLTIDDASATDRRASHGLGWRFDPPAPVRLTLLRQGEPADLTLVPEPLFPDDLADATPAGPDLELPFLRIITNPDGTQEGILPNGVRGVITPAPAPSAPATP